MLEERRKRKQKPPAGGEHKDQEHRRKDRVAEAPGDHPVRRHAAGPRQDHAIDAGQRQKARKSHDDRLHANDDDHQCEQDLVDHTDADRHDKHTKRRGHQSQSVQRNDRDVDEGQQRPDGKVNRAAARDRNRHERIGGEDQRRCDDDRTAEPGERNQARPPDHRNARQDRKQQNGNQEIGVLRTPGFRHGDCRLS